MAENCPLTTFFRKNPVVNLSREEGWEGAAGRGTKWQNLPALTIYTEVISISYGCGW
jgi:hypothetical protein